jgi:hypothetical protein
MLRRIKHAAISTRSWPRKENRQTRRIAGSNLTELIFFGYNMSRPREDFQFPQRGKRAVVLEDPSEAVLFRRMIRILS